MLVAIAVASTYFGDLASLLSLCYTVMFGIHVALPPSLLTLHVTP